MKNYKLIWSIVLLLLLTACNPFTKSRMDLFQSTPTTDLSEEHVHSISIESTELEMKKVFGEPEEVIIVDEPEAKHFVYEGIEFGVREGEVFIYFIHHFYETEKGITIGHTKKDVIRAYGKDYYEKSFEELDFIGYFDKVNGLNIEFAFSENKVFIICFEKM